MGLVVVACDQSEDPLAGQVPTGPTVLVEIQERSLTATVATATVPNVVAFGAPSGASETVGAFVNPISTGAPLVFQVVSTEGDWLEVLLPMRPNGSTGWILADRVELSETPYRVEIDVSGHRLVVWRRGELLVDTPVAIGTGTTPTPVGSFYLTELIQPTDPNGPYGPYAYGLSGFSETLSTYRGGDGVIGIHGTNEPASLGTDVSHGCVRVANEIIDDMASYLPLGTPVVISA
ncbi:MAG: L,D-transpeptidase [Actinomycetia bacterium]|nr:L,D-transpeptidase [Actinomycetes bacterium]MCP5034182.1 L,D-transpeptidase [Actinomycetes bacterium]